MKQPLLALLITLFAVSISARGQTIARANQAVRDGNPSAERIEEPADTDHALAGRGASRDDSRDGRFHGTILAGANRLL